MPRGKKNACFYLRYSAKNNFENHREIKRASGRVRNCMNTDVEQIFKGVPSVNILIPNLICIERIDIFGLVFLVDHIVGFYKIYIRFLVFTFIQFNLLQNINCINCIFILSAKKNCFNLKEVTRKFLYNL